MPIRFACPKCNQLLGVSARRAGGRVSCPKCTAEVAVPAEDDAAAAAAMRRFEQPEFEDAIHQLLVVDMPASDEPRVDNAAPSGAPSSIDRTSLLISRQVVYFQAGILAAVALIFFACGWWIGGGASSLSQPAGPQGNEPAVLDVLLHYRDAGGVERPDEGAVVLVLPADKRVTDKLPAAPLAPAAAEPNAASAIRQKLQHLGGAYGRTNAEGRLSGLNLPAPGRYQVLLLSNHARRAGEARPQDLAALGTYLDGAAELLGDRAYRLREEVLSKRVAVIHTFRGP